MKNRILPLVFTALFTSSSIIAQVCGTYQGLLEEQVQKYPAFYQGLESLNADLAANHKSALSKMRHFKTENSKKIIPVVVHVIHDGVSGNIPLSDIQNALDALNKNINGQSEKLLEMYQGQYPKTPDVFAARRGVANLEFRLARLTPVHSDCDTCTAKPTNGVLRVQSDYTNGAEPNDLVKSLSYWNAYQYLNIWVVNTIFSDNGGMTLGYAQFPNPNPNRGIWMSTDGVVILSGQMSDPESTTLTHEVGHWLGLYHTWAKGEGTCGDDDVSDTPPQHTSNGFTTDPAADPSNPNPSKFPWHVGLPSGVTFGCVADSLNPAGEMFMNYMDYTNDDYCTMFTKGQVDVFNETLEGLYDAETNEPGIGYREYMWSASNIEATGVADGYLTTCAKKADFAITNGFSSMCEGKKITIKGNKAIFGNGNVTAMVWDFGDGQTDNTNANELRHAYSTEGLFDISLTIEHSETTEARSVSLSDLDLLNASSYDSVVNTLIVQGEESELIAMGATNITLHLDSDGYSLNSFWIRDQINTDSILDAFTIETVQVIDSIFEILIYVDSTFLTPLETLLLNNADSTWYEDVVQAPADTLRTYYGKYYHNLYNGYYPDTLFYRGEIEETTYFAYYTNSCTSTTVKENFISVSPISSSNTAGGYTYSFEDAADLSADWHIAANAADGDWSFNPTQNSSWKWVDGVAVSGNACIMIDKDNLSFGSDELISETYDLSALVSPAIKFSWSGAATNAFPENELKVSYSSNCGEDWSPLGELVPLEVANAGLYTTNFKPEDKEWDDIIMSNSALKNDNIKFKFEYVTTGSANNFFIDNIQIGEESVLFSPNENPSSRISIYPNPTNGDEEFSIELEYLADMSVEVRLVNVLGAEVRNLFEGEITSNYYILNKIDLSTLEIGIYFVKVVANGNIVAADKLVLSK